MAKKIVAQPQPRPQPQPPVYCSKCNEQGIFCTCKPPLGDTTTKLEVKRLKRGTFLFSFVGGAK